MKEVKPTAVEEVKIEAEDFNNHETASLQVGGEEEDPTLAQLSFSPATSPRAKPRPFSSSSSSASVMVVVEGEKTEKRVKARRLYSDPKLKHATSGHVGKCICCKQTKTGKDGLKVPVEVKPSALIRAEEVQSNLEAAFPSFVKSLVRSHVGGCFWMGLPGPFCRAHLPRQDTTVTLVDECGNGFKMKYIAHKTGLSAGWRQFAVAHQLLEGDVLVFQLIEDCKFKVYVIRANDLTEVDGALGLLNLDAQTKQNDTDLGKMDDAEFCVAACKNRKRKRTKSLPLAVVEKENKKSGHPRSLAAQTGQPADQSENDSEEVGSEVLEGFKSSLPSLQFEEIKNYEDFNILVDGVVMDSELSEEVRSKYYKLCCSQSTFLHENLIKGLNIKLIAGIISEMVSIVDAMKDCTLSTSREEFASWDKALKASELFGMSVRFLRARLSQLVNLVFDSEGARKTRRYIEARIELDRTEEEIRNLKEKLEELMAAQEKFVTDMESLKSKAESYERRFQEEVLAPW